MDPVTQGVIGANWAQLFRSKSILPGVWLIGLLGGILPDIDIFIRSVDDPFLALKYHRHFTHSFFIIPFGGLFVASFFIFRARHYGKRFQIYLAATMGFATHALLDSFTAYGTMLYWPFSDERVAWDVISIVDPLFTFPLLLFVILAQRKKKRRIALYGFVYCVIYMSLCGWQRSRALHIQETLAQKRGHTVTQLKIHPLLFTNVVWRSLYKHDGYIYIDAIRIPWFSTQAQLIKGSRSKVFVEFKDSKLVSNHPQYMKNMRLFTHFSQNWLGYNMEALAKNDERIGDMRYSRQAQGTLPMWGIYLDVSDKDRPLKLDRSITKNGFKSTQKAIVELGQIVWGTHPELKSFF